MFVFRHFTRATDRFALRDGTYWYPHHTRFIRAYTEGTSIDFDPEDLNPINPPSDDEEQEGTSTAARAHYIDVG